MTSYRLLALTAGLSTPSSTRMLTDQLTRESAATLGRDGAEVEVTTVELREYAHDITDALLTRFPSERLAMVIEQIRAADAVIAVTPVFNVGPSGLFKLFFDAVDMELWKGKPLLLGATMAPPATRSRSTTRSARCSATSRPRWCRRRCSPPRQISVRTPRGRLTGRR